MPAKLAWQSLRPQIAAKSKTFCDVRQPSPRTSLNNSTEYHQTFKGVCVSHQLDQNDLDSLKLKAEQALLNNTLVSIDAYALLRLLRTFQAVEPLKDLLEDARAEVDELECEIREQQREINDLQEELAEMRAGVEQ